MRKFAVSSKLSTWLFLIGCLFVCGFLSAKIGLTYAEETVWVAREKIVGAEATIPIQQINILKAFSIGIPLFLAGSSISLGLAELYYSALEFFRNFSLK